MSLLPRGVVAALAATALGCGAPGGGDDAGRAWRDGGHVPGHCAGPSPPLARGAGTGDRTIEVTVGGRTRAAHVHVPSRYDANVPSMLLFDIHGFASADWQEAGLTSSSDRADERDFIVVYPQGVDASWNGGDCCGNARGGAIDDVGFVRALVDQLELEYCIDAARVFATGMSNGAFLAHRLACELSDRIVAIAPVAGVLGVAPEACTPPHPVPVLHFHGTSDPLVPYGGGSPALGDLGMGLSFRSVADSMAFWRVHNRCGATTTVVFQHGDVTCLAWDGCRASTRLCTVNGGGHTWPGGAPIPFLGATTTDIHATDAMLDWFESL